MRDDLELLGERIAEPSTHIDAAMHRLLTDVRAFDKGGGWHTQGAQSCAHWLSWRVGWSPGTAREHVRVATKLGELPVLDDALRRGLIAYSKIRAMTRVATPANEARLLEQAHFTTAAQARAAAASTPSCSARPARRAKLATADASAAATPRTAWSSSKPSLPPDEASIVWSALTRVAKEEMPTGAPAATRTLDRATALVAAAQDILRGTKKDRTPVEVVITVSKAALENTATNPLDSIAVMSDGTCISALHLERDDAPRRRCSAEPDVTSRRSRVPAHSTARVPAELRVGLASRPECDIARCDGLLSLCWRCSLAAASTKRTRRSTQPYMLSRSLLTNACRLFTTRARSSRPPPPHGARCALARLLSSQRRDTRSGATSP